MAFGNFWRGGGRERFGSERDQDRNRDRWRTTGSDWQENERDRWRDNEQRSGAWDRDRDEYSGHEGGGRENQYGGSGYGGGRQGYGGERYGGERYGGERHSSQRESYGSEPGRWGREERESDYSGMRSGGSEYDYRGGGSAYGTAGSYGEGSRGESRYGQRGFSGYGGYGSESYGSSQGYSTGQGMHRGRGPRNYRRSDDRIREDVCDCLTEDPRIDASSIEVAVTEGEVVLTGTVFQRDDKRRAEDIVERIYGVKDVRNNLRVSSEQSGERAAQAQGTQGQQGSQQGQQGSQQGQQGQTGQSSRH